MIYLYAARNLSTLVALGSPDPLSNMYDATYFRATWILTALDAGFWTAMKIKTKWLRDLAAIVFSVFYLFSADSADEKVRKIRSNLTVDHLRVSWNKGTTPYLRFFQSLTSPRHTRWPPRQLRLQRPMGSDYQEPVTAWLYFDGSLRELEESGVRKIVLDLPGGGFVAMDPRCNDDRLLAWATKTRLPVLSLDYKKAPEYPYPYALNEAFDAYTTLVDTRGRCIGLSGKEAPRIVVTGDSAGGNLATAMTLMVVESAMGPVRNASGKPALPVPDGLILFYPGLDMNIGNWMSDEQMALIRDRNTRATNRNVLKRKKSQFSNLAGTPHESTDDEAAGPWAESDAAVAGAAEPPRATDVQSPATEYTKIKPTSLGQLPRPISPETPRSSRNYHPQPLKTRLATSSMISYFNDRVLTPEMMRAMIILYVGSGNRPDFSQDYHLSPVLAPDILLARFPKTYFLTGERDPLVDDTLVFAGRLRRVKAAAFASGGRRLEYRPSDAYAEGWNDKDAAAVELIPRVSHGFMVFPSIYPPAWKWIDRAAGWIDDAFRTAEVREQERRRALLHTPANAVAAAGNEEPTDHHHHNRPRSESSGDEAPLEMTIRVRPKNSPSADEEGGNGETGKRSRKVGSGATAAAGRKTNGRAKSDKDDKVARLASHEDLLSRRMMGLTGNLTGAAAEN